jgi:hypothetical protein
MKKISIILVVILPVLFLSSCQSSKSVQGKMQILRSELDYELTSPQYPGESSKTVYLNFIDNSNMEYTTSAKKGGTLILPLLLYYHFRERFDITLGERSLIQPYWEFLTDALLAECNRSTGFHLKENKGASPDEAYILDVKINRNQTTSRIECTDAILIIPLYDGVFNFNFTNYKVNPTISDLQITVRLTQKETGLFEKTYFVNQEINGAKKEMGDPYTTCLDKMTECLSVTTKEVVESISRDLHLFMLAQQP